MKEALKPCPSCGRVVYKYAYNVSGLLTETFDSITNFDVKRILLLPILRETIIALPLVFIRALFQNIPATPGLQCQHCRKFILPCPSCDDYYLIDEFPTAFKVYNCPKCKAGFSVCESNSKFDKLLDFDAKKQWLYVISFGLLGVIIVLFINFLLN